MVPDTDLVFHGYTPDNLSIYNNIGIPAEEAH